MTTPTPEQTELEALARITAALATHDLAGFIETLQAEQPNLRSEGRVATQLRNLLTVLNLAPAAFAREHDKLDAELNPPQAPELPTPGPDDAPAGDGEDE